MLLYNAIVRPAGLLIHEVPKSDLSAAEVILLRSIHGDDGVIHLKHSKANSDASDTAERERLKAVYGEKAFARAFGSTFGSALPHEVPGDWLNGSKPADDEDESDKIPPRKTITVPKSP